MSKLVQLLILIDFIFWSLVSSNSGLANNYLVYILLSVVVFLTISLIISFVKNNRKMSQLLFLLKLREKYGKHPSEPTEVTAVSSATDCNSCCTTANHHGNQGTGECCRNSGTEPEEQSLLQNSDSTMDQTSSSETQVNCQKSLRANQLERNGGWGGGGCGACGRAGCGGGTTR